MKKFKIIAALLLAVIVASFVLVGCTAKTYNIVIANDIVGGSITVENKTSAAGDIIKVAVSPQEGYRLALGGLTYSSKKFGVNHALGNTFAMLGEDTDVSAKFEKIPVIAAGETYAREGNKIYFGEYPQSIKAESVNIGAAVTGRAGYFMGDDGKMYLKKTGSAFNDNEAIVYSNGVTVGGSEQYFLVEPMTWTILNEKDGKATIMTDNLIDSKAFLDSKNTTDPYGPGDRYNTKPGEDKKVYANNYVNSDIRAFLTDTFYNAAFTDAQQEMMESVTNNNQDGVYEKNKYTEANNNTVDKIYLLDYNDLFDADNGFQTMDDYRQKKIDPMKTSFTTDFARASGAFTQTADTEYGGMGYWWTRSAGKESYQTTVLTSSRGYVNTQGINTYKDSVGVRPVITITLK